MHVPVLQVGSGVLGSVRQIAVLAGSIILFLMLVAMIGVAYKHFQGDGIEWPDETEADGNVSRSDNDDDDEWKYY
jgi:hypothetical protein